MPDHSIDYAYWMRTDDNAGLTNRTRYGAVGGFIDDTDTRMSLETVVGAVRERELEIQTIAAQRLRLDQAEGWLQQTELMPDDSVYQTLKALIDSARATATH